MFKKKWAFKWWLYSGLRILGVAVLGVGIVAGVGRVFQRVHWYNWMGEESDVGMAMPTAIVTVAMGLALHAISHRLIRIENRVKTLEENENGVRAD